MKQLWMFCLLCLSATQVFSLEREAFTFTDYDLDIRIEPEQQRIGVRGKITLRNDSPSPQSRLSLQISSSLHWSSIQINGKPVEFLTETYTSDIDHTGALSEAVVLLPAVVPPHGTVDCLIGYEGTIPLDTTRLERIGVPKEVAKHNDWDELGRSFTAVRGIGYVAWYPVALDAASLSDGDSVVETVERWKQRHTASTMSLKLESTSPNPIFVSGTPSGSVKSSDQGILNTAAFQIVRFGIDVPTFASADYQQMSAGMSSVNYLPGHEAEAKAYADALSKIHPLESLGLKSQGLRVLQLPDAGNVPFTTPGTLLMQLTSPLTPEAELTLVYALARVEINSSRPWIQEGLAHYAQALYIEEQHGRQAALDYLNKHRMAFLDAEKNNPPIPAPVAGANLGASHSLINAPDDIYLQTKAMNVWWMLNDMLSLNPAMLHYQAADDKDATYLQRLLEKQTHKDLEWFFDDWVYRDRGLPDFRVASAYPRKLVGGGYMVTVTVENLGSAGAEVPVILKMAGEEIRKRMEVRAKSKASIRIETASIPQEVILNDGSVPESDDTNNTYKIVPPEP